MNILIKIFLMAILWFAGYTSLMNGFVYHKTDDLIGGAALYVLLVFWIYRTIFPKKRKYYQE